MEGHINRRRGCGIHVVGHRERHGDGRDRNFRVTAEGTGGNRADALSDQRPTAIARRAHAAENFHPGDVWRLDPHGPVTAADSVDVVEIDRDRLHCDLDFARSRLRYVHFVASKHVGRCTEFLNPPRSHVAPSSRLPMQPCVWPLSVRQRTAAHPPSGTGSSCSYKLMVRAASLLAAHKRYRPSDTDVDLECSGDISLPHGAPLVAESLRRADTGWDGGVSTAPKPTWLTRYGRRRGRRMIAAACSGVATGLPDFSQSSTASATSSTLVGLRSPP